MIVTDSFQSRLIVDFGHTWGHIMVWGHKGNGNEEELRNARAIKRETNFVGQGTHCQTSPSRVKINTSLLEINNAYQKCEKVGLSESSLVTNETLLWQIW